MTTVTETQAPPPPSPSNPVLLATQAQWLFSDDELTRTPSQLDGMKLENEHISRSKGVNFITQVGIMLKLPQLTLATAAVYIHRFFMRFSMVDLPQRPGMHPYPIAATSLFLATKVEENVRRMKEIVVSCCRVAQKQPNLVVDEQSKEFWKWRDTILHHEDMLLEALCFDLQLEQPYRILYEFICFFGVAEHKALRNTAWAFVNDSMYTVLCLQFNARTIAAAALYAAARHCDVGFKDDDRGRPWWDQLDVDIPQVRRACLRMAQLYENNALQKHSQHYPTTPITTSTSSSPVDDARIPRLAPPVAEGNNNNNNNGRKRSREPEDTHEGLSNGASGSGVGAGAGSGSGSGSNLEPERNDRSPKRQRTVDPEDKPEGSQVNGHLPKTETAIETATDTGERVDPVQARIDNIVSQNLPQSTAQSHDHHNQEQDHDRERDRHREEIENERKLPERPGHQAKEPEEPGEIDEGSEEGEL